MPVDNARRYSPEEGKSRETAYAQIAHYHVHPLSRAQVHRVYTRMAELPLINADRC